MNHEGYRDPTADTAIANLEKKTPDYIMDVIRVLRLVADLAGLEFIGRVQLRDKVTGREYR